MHSTAHATTSVHPTSVSLLLAAVHGARERTILEAVDARLERTALKAQLRNVLKSLEPVPSRIRRAG